MNIQILIVIIFAVNMLIIRLATLNNKFGWFKPIAGIVFNFLPLVGVFFMQPRFELDYFWWKVAGLIALSLGFIILGWAINEFKKQTTSFRFDSNPEEFVNSGPFQFVRHPYYLGLIFVWIGWWWVWSAVYSFYLGMFIVALTWLQAYVEEKLIMEKKFGEQYASYKTQTGMFWIK